MKVDSSSGTVGRRYARADELGIPFGVTIDFQTLMDESVTVRDRDSMGQIRVPLTSLKELLLMLVHEQIDWSRVLTRYPSVQMAAEEEEVEGGSKKTEEANKEMKKGGSALVVETSLRGSFSRPAAKA